MLPLQSPTKIARAASTIDKRVAEGKLVRPHIITTPTDHVVADGLLKQFDRFISRKILQILLSETRMKQHCLQRQPSNQASCKGPQRRYALHISAHGTHRNGSIRQQTVYQT